MRRSPAPRLASSAVAIVLIFGVLAMAANPLHASEPLLGHTLRDDAQQTVPGCPPTVGALRINEGYTPSISAFSDAVSFSLLCPYGTDDPNSGGFLSNRGRVNVRWSEGAAVASGIALRCGVDDDTAFSGQGGGTGDIGEVFVYSDTSLASVQYDADLEFADAMAALAKSLLAEVERTAIPCNPEVICPPAPDGLRLNLDRGLHRPRGHRSGELHLRLQPAKRFRQRRAAQLPGQLRRGGARALARLLLQPRLHLQRPVRRTRSRLTIPSGARSSIRA